jgi:hypothetical protein
MSAKKSMGSRFHMLFQTKPHLGESIGFRRRFDNFFSNIRKNEKQAKEGVDNALKREPTWMDEGQKITRPSFGTYKKTENLDASSESMNLLIHVGRMNIVLDKVKKMPDLVSQMREAFQIYIEENQSEKNKSMLVMPWKKFETSVDATRLNELKGNLGKVQLDMDADKELLAASLKAIQSRIDKGSAS